MKNITQRNLLLIAFALGLFGLTGHAQARIGLDIEIAGPPPPSRVEVVEPWTSPGYGAVWVKPHHEWADGRWVWIDGYYEYPPRSNAVYVEGRYEQRNNHHYWSQPHWK